jgi:hypothetical protein
MVMRQGVTALQNAGHDHHPPRLGEFELIGEKL